MSLQDGWITVRKNLASTVRKCLGSLTHILTEDPVVSLTFDDSPDPKYTPMLLDLLNRYHAKATFFMVGEAAQKFPHLVRMVADGGHAIGGHSYDHPSFAHISGVERRKQMRTCQHALAPYGQRLFRPPYGEQTIASRLDAFWLRYEVVCWNVDVGDWHEPDASLMADRLVNWIHPGAIVLLHDTLFDRGSETPGRGPKFAAEPHLDREPAFSAIEVMFRRIGYQFQFVTIPELLRHGVPRREFWFRQAPVA